MGVKRPLEEESLPELSFEQHKQLDNNKRLAFVAEDFPSHTAALEVDSLGEAKSDFCKLDYDGVLESGGIGDACVASKEVEASEEDVGIKNTSFCSNFRGLDFDMPWRPPQAFDDPYVYLLNVAPRKEIPVGPDYQAEVPKWDPSASVKDFPDSDNFDKQEFMGTCIVPMPCLNESTTCGFTVGCGRTSDCSCLDMGSMRCVQQHVMEAREKLRDTFGDEMFTKLGFYEMGEEIASRWTSKDQRLFHEVIFGNPCGDFWRHLSAVFPTRTKKELVSYYFNVFVLRRRGVQNRSYMLQIDSDHDEEWKDARVDYQQNRPLVDDNDPQLVNGDFHVVGVEGEDSEVESFTEQELDAWGDEYESVHENVGGDVDDGAFDGNGRKKDDVYEGSNDNHGPSGGNVCKQGGVEMDGGAGQLCGQETS